MTGVCGSGMKLKSASDVYVPVGIWIPCTVCGLTAGISGTPREDGMNVTPGIVARAVLVVFASSVVVCAVAD